jgi:DNA polymerase bacteriophage-type
MSLLHIDFEVYSEVSIKSAPLDVYAFHPSTKIILAAYAFDDGPVKVWQESDGPLVELREGIKNTDNILVAWNVNYERTVLRGRGLNIPIERWTDPMVHARYAGLPGRLKDVAKIPMVGVPTEEKTKSETLLINRFCMPNKEGRRVMPSEHPEDWAKFVEYCRKDVQTMRHVLNWLTPRFPFPESERELWILDQKINERGLPVDVEMAAHAEKEVARIAAHTGQELKTLTGLENPNSVQQLLPWLKQGGYPYDSLGKEFLEQALALPVWDQVFPVEQPEGTLTRAAREVVLLRSGAAKSSVKKFRTIVEMASPDVM